MSATLWHYTCTHRISEIGETGILLPPLYQLAAIPDWLPRDAYPLLGLVWATDMDPPQRLALGLTDHTIACDRTTARYAVPASAFTRWGRWRHLMPPWLVDELELANGAQPARWWVADRPVPGAVLDKEWPDCHAVTAP